MVPLELTYNLVLDEATARSLLNIVLCLLGIFNGEEGVNHHIINVVNNSMSGLQTKRWVEKLVSVAN